MRFLNKFSLTPSVNSVKPYNLTTIYSISSHSLSLKISESNFRQLFGRKKVCG